MQAGVALGLAKKVHLEYKVWGGDFATTIVSVVVINQLVGPPLCKWVMKYIHKKNERDRLAGERPQVLDSDDKDPPHPGLNRRGQRRNTPFSSNFAEVKVSVSDDEDDEGDALLQSEHEENSDPPADVIRPHWPHALASSSTSDPSAPRIYIVGCGSYTKANGSPNTQWVKEVAAQHSARMAAAGLHPTIFSVPSAAVLMPPAPASANLEEGEDLQGDHENVSKGGIDAAIASGPVADSDGNKPSGDVQVYLHRQGAIGAGLG